MDNLIKSTLSFLFIGFSLSGIAQNKTSVTPQPSADAPQISKHIYGHFAEHLGRCIYGGFYVGEDSEIPNLDGVRKDIIAAIKGNENTKLKVARRLLRRHLSLERRGRG